nr:hypothetical protein [Rhizobium rhizogenes]
MPTRIRDGLYEIFYFTRADILSDMTQYAADNRSLLAKINGAANLFDNT